MFDTLVILKIHCLFLAQSFSCRDGWLLKRALYGDPESDENTEEYTGEFNGEDTYEVAENCYGEDSVKQGDTVRDESNNEPSCEKNSNLGF